MTPPHRRGVLLDANLLVLYVVGSRLPSLLGNHRRLKEFEPDDFELLKAEIAGRHLVSTPHVLAETSNLVRYGARTEATNALGATIRELDEEFCAARLLVEDHAFGRLGLADAAVLAAASRVEVVFTVDMDLYLAMAYRGLPAINFNHLRGRRWEGG